MGKSKNKKLLGQYIMDFDYDCNVVLVPLDNLKQWESWIKTADVYPPPALPDYVVPLKCGVSGAIFTDPVVLGKRLVKT